MTIEELKVSGKPLLTCQEVGEILGVDPHGIRIWARANPSALGFPVMRYGKHGEQIRIPRVSFLKFLGEI